MGNASRGPPENPLRGRAGKGSNLSPLGCTVDRGKATGEPELAGSERSHLSH